MPQATEYKPVTVETAKRIAEEFDKAIVVIVAIDRAHGLIHYTTYGQSAGDKLLAARCGDVVAAVISGEQLKEKATFEDFRLDAAKIKEGADALRAERDKLRVKVEKLEAECRSWDRILGAIRKYSEGDKDALGYMRVPWVDDLLGERDRLRAEVARLSQPDRFAPAAPAVLLASVMAERDAYRERVVALEAVLKPFADNYANNRAAMDEAAKDTFAAQAVTDFRRAHEVLYAPVTVEVLASFNPPVVILPAAPASPAPAAEGQG